MKDEQSGPIDWMARNSVAANLAMLLLIFGGLIFGSSVKQEIFPEIELDFVNVAVPYPGASPEEVEQGVCLPIEEAIAGIDGVKTISALANEGAGVVTAEIMLGADADKVLQDIKDEVDRLRTLPEQAEEPTVSKAVSRKEVLSVAVAGPGSERAIREIAERVRDDLLALPQITQVELSGVRPYEISIEVREEVLRKLGLTLEQIASRVRQSSIDVPGGVLKALGGEVLLRTKERKELGEEYRKIQIISSADGTEVELGEIADVRDSFEDVDQYGLFDSSRAAMVKVFRIGNQTPFKISEAVHSYIEEKNASLPQGVKLTVWNDRSEMLESRLNLLLKNAAIGLLLVFLILGTFLELKLAFWVTLGIPISFMGALFLLPATGVTINMISLFAFILSLGIVVDDAIIVGENVYRHQEKEGHNIEAAVSGARDVVGPVTFSVLTSVAAFLPMLFVTGTMGKFIWVIPGIVIPVLLMSLFESLYILPAHLAHSKPITPDTPLFGGVERRRQRFSAWLKAFIEGPYQRKLRTCLAHRYVTMSVGVAVLFLLVGLIAGGYIKFVNMPYVDGDTVKAKIEMPVGTPISETEKVADFVYQAGSKTIEQFNEEYSPEGGTALRNSYALFGGEVSMGGHGGGRSASGAHLSNIVFFLKPSDVRGFSASVFAKRWRENVGELPGIKSLRFASDLLGGGEDINIQLEHESFETLKEASRRIQENLSSRVGVFDIADNFAVGKRELKFQLRPQARTLGITEAALGKQVRAAFYGAEALRFQRGRNELKVMVRYPKEQRLSIGDIERMRVRTPEGGEVPFEQVASVVDSRGYSQVRRSERKRVVNVTAAVEENDANANEVIIDLQRSLMKQLKIDYPGLSFSLEGKENDRRESNQSLFNGYYFAMMLIYALLAVPFKSYVQPVIVMCAIPFGLVGACLGHLLLGHSISMLSMCGIVALSGVVVNDSLILVDFANRARRAGESAFEAIVQAGLKRFRPIVLTSLTTFFGLAPIIMEKSVQAKFLIPMAISLGFGILFATVITLLLIPCLYLIVEDILALVARMLGREQRSDLQQAA